MGIIGVVTLAIALKRRYILHKYWMRNSISPFYDVCKCLQCHFKAARQNKNLSEELKQDLPRHSSGLTKLVEERPTSPSYRM